MLLGGEDLGNEGDEGLLGHVLFWVGNSNLSANLDCQKVSDFRMPWDRRRFICIGKIYITGVLCTFS